MLRQTRIAAKTPPDIVSPSGDQPSRPVCREIPLDCPPQAIRLFLRKTLDLSGGQPSGHRLAAMVARPTQPYLKILPDR